MNTIPYVLDNADGTLTEVIDRFGLEECRCRADDAFILEMKHSNLQIRSPKNKNFGPVHVDFTAGKVAHRRIFGSPRNEAITRAVGFRKYAVPSILDLTAGLGQDAFVLASIGCRVHLIERCGIVAALLYDGLKRAEQDDEIGAWVAERMSLSFEDSLAGLNGLPFEPDVVYIDAMFPEKKKSALVRKEIQLLQRIVGSDPDQDRLLEAGQGIAKDRVVVKRPNSAESLNAQKPNTSIRSKNYRLDIYLLT